MEGQGQGFRSSPNFKHMKKYQKAKAHLSPLAQDPPPINPVEETKPVEEPVAQPPPPPPEVKQEPCLIQPYQSYEELPPQLDENSSSQPNDNQPPLPPDIKPPLIDMKPPLLIEVFPPLPPHPPPMDIKQEMEDSEIEYVGTSQQPPQYMDYEEGMSIDNQPEETMCRNFIRGVCNRGSSCIFTHRLIMSQLKNVYRFCNDFQNSTCKRPRCRFVHATVFEKEKFLRTGYLPQHAVSHINDNVSVLPPPPPPPPEEPDVPMFYSMMPPPPPPPPPPAPPVTESMQAPTDSMMMYAPGPSGYQASMRGQTQTSLSPMQTSMITPTQTMQAPTHDPVQAMQSSILTSSQGIQALMRNPPPTTMRTSSQIMQTTSHGMHDSMQTSSQVSMPVPPPSMHVPPPPIHVPPPPMPGPSLSMHGPPPSMHGPPPSMHGPTSSMHGPPPSMHGPPPSMHGPPPTMQTSMQDAHQAMQTSFHMMQAPQQVQSGIDLYTNPMPGTSSSTSTDWSQYESRPSSSYEQVKPTARNSTSCSSCDINDFRLKYNINKNEKLRRENEDMDRKIAELAVKKQVISIFLAKIFKSNGGWSKTATTDADRQRALMEQLTALLSAGDL